MHQYFFRISFSILFLFIFVSCKQKKEFSHFWPSEKSPSRIAELVSKDLLSRNDFMMYNTEQVKALHYSEVGTAFGILRFAGMESDSSTIHEIQKRYQPVFDGEVPNTVNHVDANVVGVLPLELYLQTGREDYLSNGITLADSQWVDPLPDGLTKQTRFWIDDIWMIGALQIQAYRATGEMIYLDRIAKETVAYLDSLQQPNGLFFHGPNAQFFWGRGNGWVAAGLAEILLELPEDHPDYPRIVEGYTTMMNSLLESQAEDGMWRQLINEPTAWKETSSTAMFGYAFVVGVKKGILSKEKFEPAYQKTWLSLTDYLNEEGKLSEVCTGTGQSTDINYYLDRPRITGDFHGQAPLIWFAWALASN